MSRLLVEVQEGEARYGNPDAEDARSGVRYIPVEPTVVHLPPNLVMGCGTFGDALVAIKNGFRVRRAGWNGKGMWLALTEGSTVPAFEAELGGIRFANTKLRGAAEEVARELGASAPLDALIKINAHIDMRAADGTLVIGWLASQTDMLAEDWEVLP